MYGRWIWKALVEETTDKGMDQKEKQKQDVEIGGRIASAWHCHLQGNVLHELWNTWGNIDHYWALDYQTSWPKNFHELSYVWSNKKNYHQLSWKIWTSSKWMIIDDSRWCRNWDICFFHFCHTKIDEQDAKNKTFLSLVKLLPTLCTLAHLGHEIHTRLLHSVLHFYLGVFCNIDFELSTTILNQTIKVTVINQMKIIFNQVIKYTTFRNLWMLLIWR